VAVDAELAHEEYGVIVHRSGAYRSSGQAQPLGHAVPDGRSGRPHDDVNQQRRAEIKPWMLFALPAAIAVPIIAGILVGGPVVGFPVAALVALVIVAVAIRLEPRARRRTAARTDARDHALAAPPDTGDHSWRRAAARRLLVPLLIAAAGIVLIAAAAGTVNIIGWGVLAVAVTVAISLVFLEIGRSEDRARAREERAGGRRRPRGGPRRAPR
jgi:hypothetical protein